MKQFTKGFRTAFAVLGCFLAFSSVRAEENFTFNDIHYWIGSGTNRAAVVVDWNNGKPNSSLAWGIRWNGASVNMTYWLRRIATEDKRLHIATSSGAYGTSLDGFAYDADGDGGTFDFANEMASDPDDFIGSLGNDLPYYYWAGTVINGTEFDSEAVWEETWYGIDGMYPEHGDWFGYQYMYWFLGMDATPSRPVFSESPFAYSVVASSTDPDLNEGKNTVPEAVLGAPSRLVMSDRDDSPVVPVVSVVSPVIPAWQTEQVFSLSKTEDPASGFITVAFDHPVVDDPLNPYGLDFIIFGNTICQGSGGSPVGDPSRVNIIETNPDYAADEAGLVEVSQDGETWYSYSEGPFADTFAPIFGHRYESGAPDANLFPGNLWWGSPTDPTLPLDPSLSTSDFIGKTLAQMSILYNGSAGGTGFDIGGFELPVDPTTGRKWIQYVRVTSKAAYDPDEDSEWTEIDAFADVAPALPYDNWVRENYDWTQLPNTNIVGKSVIAANGKPNFYNAAFGTAPDATAVENFAISSFTIEDGKAIFRVPSAQFAFDAFRIGKASVVNGTYRNSLPTYEGTLLMETGFESVFSVPVDSAATNAFYKVGISD